MVQFINLLVRNRRMSPVVGQIYLGVPRLMFPIIACHCLILPFGSPNCDIITLLYILSEISGNQHWPRVVNTICFAMAGGGWEKKHDDNVGYSRALPVLGITTRLHHFWWRNTWTAPFWSRIRIISHVITLKMSRVTKFLDLRLYFWEDSLWAGYQLESQ